MFKKSTLYIQYVVGLAILMISIIYFAPQALKISSTYSYLVEQVGSSHTIDLNNSTSEPERIEERLIRTDAVSHITNDIAVIENNYKGFDASNNITFDSSRQYAVDRYTKENVTYGDIEKIPGHFSFPPHVEMKEYLFSSPEVVEKPENMIFDRALTVSGVKVYKFDYAIPKTDKTHFFPDEISALGNVLGDHSGSVWVEPTTGFIVDFTHSGRNDIHDRETGDLIMFFQTWENGFTQDTVSANIDHVKDVLMRYRLFSVIVPTAVVLYLVIITILYARRRKFV